MIKQYYKSIGVKKRKQDVIAFVNTVTQFIHRGSYAHIVTVARKFSWIGFTYDFYANRWRMCSISYYFRNSSVSINNVTNVNYDIDLQKVYVFV